MSQPDENLRTLPSTCPSCGAVAVRQSYDIGSGPEYSCADCEWCWGALGQDLKPVRPPEEVRQVLRNLGFHDLADNYGVGEEETQ